MTTAETLILTVAVLQTAFMVLECVAWVWLSQRVLGIDEATARKTKVLGFNQGVYNGFFAAALFVTFLPELDPVSAHAVAVFSLGSVAVAGIVGFLTTGYRPAFLVLQSAPAIAGLVVVLDLLGA